MIVTVSPPLLVYRTLTTLYTLSSRALHPFFTRRWSTCYPPSAACSVSVYELWGRRGNLTHGLTSMCALLAAALAGLLLLNVYDLLEYSTRDDPSGDDPSGGGDEPDAPPDMPPAPFAPLSPTALVIHSTGQQSVALLQAGGQALVARCGTAEAHGGAVTAAVRTLGCGILRAAQLLRDHVH